MSKTATVYFDGSVLRPEGPLDLEPNKRYVITFEADPQDRPKSIWDVFEEMAGTVEAPSDWAAEHDHYIHGTPKRGPEVDE